MVSVRGRSDPDGYSIEVVYKSWQHTSLHVQAAIQHSND
jgi:hypothetical protein